jgi:hypothetical protein
MVYKFPMLISGVNTMSNKRLEKVDLEGMKNALCKVLLIGGAVMLLLGVLTTLIHIPMGVHLVALFAVILGIVVASVLISRRYDAGLQGEEGKKERKKNLIGIIIAVVVTVGVLFFFFKGAKPATIEVSEDYITAKGGGYSATIPMSDITTATVLTGWPSISIRTNGLSTEKVSIGHFRLKGGESCMLFLCEDGGPVLEVRTVDGKLYYLNCATEEETLEMIAKVKEILNKRPVTGNHYHDTPYRYGGQGSAISQARRRHLSVWEIAGQARNDGKGLDYVVQGSELKTILS